MLEQILQKLIAAGYNQKQDKKLWHKETIHEVRTIAINPARVVFAIVDNDPQEGWEIKDYSYEEFLNESI